MWSVLYWISAFVIIIVKNIVQITYFCNEQQCDTVKEKKIFRPSHSSKIISMNGMYFHLEAFSAAYKLTAFCQRATYVFKIS